MKVLVTGGAGFIGSHLAHALVKRGDRVRIIDNLSAGAMKNLKAVSKEVEFQKGDIRNPAALRKAMKGVEVVYHQAALRSVPKSVDNPSGYHDVNVTATFHIFQLARELGIKRVVYASSSSVYGDGTPLPQKETALAKPQSPYAASKLATEVYGGMFMRLFGLETVGLRYFNVYGPRQSLENKYAVAVPKFIISVLRGEQPPIHGNGKQTRDFTYVDNVVQANIKSATAPASKASGEAFNIASGDSHSVLELALLIAKIFKSDLKPRFISKRPGDVMHTWADIGKAKKQLGFKVGVSFQEGVRRTAEWFDQNRSEWNLT